MPDYNELVVDPRLFYVRGGLDINPNTILSRPRQFDSQTVKTMTVANGDVLYVYDVTDPANPILTGTIG